MRQKIFRWLANFAGHHSGKMLIGSLIMTLLMVGFATRLKLKTEIADLLPGYMPEVQQFEEIMEEFTATSTITVALSDETHKDKKKLAAVAEEVAESIKDARYIRAAEGLDGIQKLTIFFKSIPFIGFDLAVPIPMDTTPLVKRIDLKVDRDFIDNHGFMLQKTKDLENSTEMFRAITLPDLIENINNNLEMEFIEDSDNMASIDGETQAVNGLEGMYKFTASIDSFLNTGDTVVASKGIAQFLAGDDYMFSSDNTTLLMMLQPTVGMKDHEAAMALCGQLQQTLKELGAKHPDIKIGYAGALMMQKDEQNALGADFQVSTVVAIMLIILLLASSFRTWKTPFLAVVVLIISIIWVAGALGIVLVYLTIMSASFGIILIGLGIDFGIHLISGFRDGREQGKDVKESIIYMYDRVATGVLTGGMTTAIVFYALVLTGFKSFAELGIAVGTGIIVTMFGMMIVLPAAISWTTGIDGEDSHAVVFFKKIKLGFLVSGYDRLGKKIGQIFQWKPLAKFLDFMEFGFIARAVRYIHNPIVAAVIVICAVGFAIAAVPMGQKIKFEFDLTNLQPEGVISVVTQDSIISKFDMNTDFGLMLSDNLHETRKALQDVKNAADRYGMIGRVDGITEFLPTPEVQEVNQEILSVFRQHVSTLEATDAFGTQEQEKLIAELERLHANIVEMAELSIMGEGENSKIVTKADQIVGKKDKDSKILAIAARIRALKDPAALGLYQKTMGETLVKKLTSMSNPAFVTLDSLPDTIKERYLNSKGQNLISIFPKGNIWDEDILRKFNSVMKERVSSKVTGMPSIMQIYMDMTKERGGFAILLGAIAIIIFLVIDFRSLSDTILAIIPLAIGTLWMVGILYLMGEKFNMVSFMALPLIIGIGIDNGVHILHRYKLEGSSSLEEVMRFTGRAILLATLTTAIGFGSMAFASHRGIASMGRLLVVGVFSCFVTSAFVLTSLLSLKQAIFKNRGARK